MPSFLHICMHVRIAIRACPSTKIYRILYAQMYARIHLCVHAAVYNHRCMLAHKNVHMLVYMTSQISQRRQIPSDCFEKRLVDQWKGMSLARVRASSFLHVSSCACACFCQTPVYMNTCVCAVVSRALLGCLCVDACSLHMRTYYFEGAFDIELRLYTLMLEFGIYHGASVVYASCF